eukprot:TRINITY_DN54968_c0_g1_i1.p1 TRINITY_DN54968_c0_g1~~TRINITY_DN54968_c0_g1_i1.p1  ORF type:complete len:285 (-),score=41.58 TRINITY_DN54968_c0_g1_i1:394-1248(-)
MWLRTHEQASRGGNEQSTFEAMASEYGKLKPYETGAMTFVLVISLISIVGLLTVMCCAKDGTLLPLPLVMATVIMARVASIVKIVNIPTATRVVSILGIRSSPRQARITMWLWMLLFSGFVAFASCMMPMMILDIADGPAKRLAMQWTWAIISMEWSMVLCVLLVLVRALCERDDVEQNTELEKEEEKEEEEPPNFQTFKYAIHDQPSDQSEAGPVLLGRVAYGETMCAICLESFEEGEMVGQPPCSHTFHKFCYRSWLRKSNQMAYCPFRCSEKRHAKLTARS